MDNNIYQNFFDLAKQNKIIQDNIFKLNDLNYNSILIVNEFDYYLVKKNIDRENINIFYGNFNTFFNDKFQPKNYSIEDAIINSDYGRYFEVDEYIPKETYIRDLFTTRRGEKAQIINFNLNYVDERFAKTLTKIYSKLFLDYAISLESRGGFPLQIILEEAHRYVQNDDDVRNIGYNIFDRITKEGRKYGVVLGLITQRPSELSNTALSQCSNYIVLRMFHPEDLKIIKSMTHSIAEEDIEKLKALRPGVALCFGNAFNIPVFVKIDKPDPTPDSNNAHIGTEWFKEPSEILKEKQLQAQKNTIEIQQYF